MDFLYITGSIPFSLDNLRNLAFLYLSYNQINGSIPLKIWSLANLKALDLSSNNISGSIHITVGSLTQGSQFRSGLHFVFSIEMTCFAFKAFQHAVSGLYCLYVCIIQNINSTNIISIQIER
jgi:hypothetical protein